MTEQIVALIAELEYINRDIFKELDCIASLSSKEDKSKCISNCIELMQQISDQET